MSTSFYLILRKMKPGCTEELDVEKMSITTPKSPPIGKMKVLPLESLETLSDNFVQSDDTVNYEYEDLANILDKLCFVLFFLVTFIMTFTFLLIMVCG